METGNPSNEAKPAVNETTKEVSLAPACLVFAVIGAVLASFFVIALTAYMGSPGNMAYALREEYIPWVEQAPLVQSDKQIVVDRLQSLASSIERESLTRDQVYRVGLRIRESAILQWGVVEKLVAAAKQSQGLTEDEKQEFASQCDRWLLSATLGKLAFQDMEFALQNVAVKDVRTRTLTLRDNITDEKMREFLRRIETMMDKLKVPKEPYNKSVSQAFLQVIDEAIAEK